jgi:hypothetical protein
MYNNTSLTYSYSSVAPASLPPRRLNLANCRFLLPAALQPVLTGHMDKEVGGVLHCIMFHVLRGQDVYLANPKIYGASFMLFYLA